MSLEPIKKGRKWFVDGGGDEWIFNKIFPAKWKAELAINIYENGGRYSGYRKAVGAAMRNCPKNIPQRAIDKITPMLEEMIALDPTCDEIKEYGKDPIYGLVSHTTATGYFAPSLHDTWQDKRSGRVHIDIGCDQVHLMLDYDNAIEFIETIKSQRNRDLSHNFL